MILNKNSLQYHLVAALLQTTRQKEIYNKVLEIKNNKKSNKDN
jgi:hypothetical protein